MKACRLFLAAALAGGLALPLPAQTVPFAAKPVGDAQLGAIAGQADVLNTINAQNRATVANNQVTGNSVTGDISFDPSSFSELNGLALISANSGNNVAINASLNVNVAIRP